MEKQHDYLLFNKAVAVQLVTVLELTYTGLLEGAVVTENVFAWPGLGQYLTTAFCWLTFSIDFGTRA